MADLVDQEQRDARVRRRGGERLALAVGHQRIAAAVHQDQVAVQLREVVEREVEAVDLPPHPSGRAAISRVTASGSRFSTSASTALPSGPSFARQRRRHRRRDRGSGSSRSSAGMTRRPDRRAGRHWRAGRPSGRSCWASTPMLARIAERAERAGGDEADRGLRIMVAADADDELPRRSCSAAMIAGATA